MTLGHEKLDGWGYSGKEERAIYKTNEIDPDSDFDPDKKNFNQTVEATPNGVPHFQHQQKRNKKESGCVSIDFNLDNVFH